MFREKRYAPTDALPWPGHTDVGSSVTQSPGGTKNVCATFSIGLGGGWGHNNNIIPGRMKSWKSKGPAPTPCHSSPPHSPRRSSSEPQCLMDRITAWDPGLRAPRYTLDHFFETFLGPMDISFHARPTATSKSHIHITRTLILCGCGIGRGAGHL